MIEVRDSYYMYSIYWINCLVAILTRTLLDVEDVLDLTLPYRQTALPIYMDMCEYNTLNANVCDGINFWTVWSYYFRIPPLMSLTDVLMALVILITRDRDDLDFILIEDVALYFWIVETRIFGFTLMILIEY